MPVHSVGRYTKCFHFLKSKLLTSTRYFEDMIWQALIIITTETIVVSIKLNHLLSRTTSSNLLVLSLDKSFLMTGILGQLKWEPLKKNGKDNRLILLYKCLKEKASVPTDDLIPKTRRCRTQHSMAFQTPIANTDVYKGSFFPQTIRDWNALPDSLISSAEDAEDCAAKFTSLVRARD